MSSLETVVPIRLLDFVSAKHCFTQLLQNRAHIPPFKQDTHTPCPVFLNSVYIFPPSLYPLLPLVIPGGSSIIPDFLLTFLEKAYTILPLASHLFTS